MKEFKDNVPGKDFVEHFIQRNHLSVRLAANIKRARAAVGVNAILEFFDNIKDVLADADPRVVFNYDETNVQDDPGARKVVVPRGTKRVERVQQHSKASVSIMVCGNAAGELLPPMVVYKAGNLYDNWTRGGPPGTIYSNTASGWFDMIQFEKWFFEILLPKLKDMNTPEKKIIIGDNLASHFSPLVIEACEQNNIYMTPLPANSTHLMQPLDVAVFAPMKKKWREILDKWRSESKSSASIPKEYFPTLLNRLWNAVNQNVSRNLKSGFKGTGICPYDPIEVLKRIPGALPENAEENNEIMSQSLIDVLQELRGSNKEKPTRKRGKKVDPGKKLQSVDPSAEPVAGPSKEPVAGPSKEPVTLDSSDDEDLQPITFKKTVVNDSDDSDDLPLITVKKTLNTIIVPPRKQTKRKAKTTNDFCASCYARWKNYKGPDWICCKQCSKWICGVCNEGTDDPFYVCTGCKNNCDFDSDDSLKDKDFCV